MHLVLRSSPVSKEQSCSKRVTPDAGQVDALDSDICYEITDVAVDRHVLQNHNCRTMVLTKWVSSSDEVHETDLIAPSCPNMKGSSSPPCRAHGISAGAFQQNALEMPGARDAFKASITSRCLKLSL